jgi:hypothetical protein
MKLFLSWSGEESKAVAVLLREWLPHVLQSVEPWISNEDISPGSRWSPEIGRQLESCGFGIVCVTATNQHSQWLNFEAGALAKEFDAGRVVPFLVGLNPADLTGPLTQFQAITATKLGITRLLKAINDATESPLIESRLINSTEMWWPRFEEGLKGLTMASPTPQASTRDLRSIMQDVLDISRKIQRQMAIEEFSLDATDDDPYGPLVEQIHERLKATGHDVYKFSVGYSTIILYTDDSINPEVLDQIERRAARFGRKIEVKPENAEVDRTSGYMHTYYDR